MFYQYNLPMHMRVCLVTDLEINYNKKRTNSQSNCSGYPYPQHFTFKGNNLSVQFYSENTNTWISILRILPFTTFDCNPTHVNKAFKVILELLNVMSNIICSGNGHGVVLFWSKKNHWNRKGIRPGSAKNEFLHNFLMDMPYALSHPGWCSLWC